MEDAKTCLRYRLRASNRGTTFLDVKLEGFNDANYSTAYPSGCRIASGHVVVFLRDGAVSACSRLLSLLETMSVVEAEYQALNMVVHEAVFLRQMLGEFGFPQLGATPINEDNNQACI
jgi:hypothetical protein